MLWTLTVRLTKEPQKTVAVLVSRGGKLPLSRSVMEPMLVSETGEPENGAPFPSIVFRSGRDGNLEIYVMDADGGNPINLTQNPASDANLHGRRHGLAVSPKARFLTLWATIKASH